MAKSDLVFGTQEFYAAIAEEAAQEHINIGKPWARPQKSMALGCHPSQVEALNERNRKRGVSVTYDRFGRAVIPDRNERRKLLEVEHMHDNEGGYGDG